MVALHSILPERDGMRGGKSELQRAGWFVTRTVPGGVAVTLPERGQGECHRKDTAYQSLGVSGLAHRSLGVGG